MNKVRGITVPLIYTTKFCNQNRILAGRKTQNPIGQSKKTGRKPMGPDDH